MSYTGAALASKVAAQEWAEDFADLLTCFSTEQVNKSLFALFATTHRGDQPILYSELCEALVDLIDRGVIAREFPISGVAAEELEELRAQYAPHSVPSSVPSSAPVAQALAMNPVDECASDFRTLNSSQFKQKWMGTRRNVYEKAIAAGRI